MDNRFQQDMHIQTRHPVQLLWPHLYIHIQHYNSSSVVIHYIPTVVVLIKNNIILQDMEHRQQHLLHQERNYVFQYYMA